MANCVIEGREYDPATVDKIVSDAAIPVDDTRAALISGWSKGAEQKGKTQPISPDECNAMCKVLLDAGFELKEFQWTPGGWAMVFSRLIWAVLHDKLADLPDFPPGVIKFNLQAGEVPVWSFSMLLKQQCTTTSYVGVYGGPSIRVASGLYYRFGEVRGHRVQSTSLQEVDHGDFLLTTRAIYFGGNNRGVSFRLPYDQVIRFQPYSDAVGICKNGTREQIFVPTNVNTPVGVALASSADPSRVRFRSDGPRRIIPFPDSGWFLFNILQALAAKNSGARVS